ncbi:MAG: hypothetical protein H8F28_03920 [Fibrella sp.]|nr:hypothetical protein [Armatimonadota bacterium]
MNSAEILPYRRTLGKEESDALWGQLKGRWQVTGGYYYPTELIKAIPPRVVVFPADAFEAAITPEVLRTVLSEHGVRRVFEFFEFSGGPEYEIDLALLDPCYGSSGELYCTSAAMDWLIYASHENTITFAGEWLIEAIQAKWNNWSQHVCH